MATGKASETSVKKIKSVGIIGAGQMGAGIAQTCLQAGYPVHLIDISKKTLDTAKAIIADNFDRMIDKKSIDKSQKDFFLKALQTSTKFSGCAECDLVIEAATENEALKIKIFTDLQKDLKRGAVIATNTSSLSITRLGAASGRAEKFIGLHFMNPVPLMPLMEIIQGLNTDEDTFQITHAFAESLGKTAVSVNDIPGFVVNRLLIPMINEAVFVLYERVATVEAIDDAMQLGARHPMGPLALADLIGLDTVLAVMKVLQEELGDNKYRPCPLLVKYVDAGWLGRKSGRGFYEYRA